MGFFDDLDSKLGFSAATQPVAPPIQVNRPTDSFDDLDRKLGIVSDDQKTEYFRLGGGKTKEGRLFRGEVMRSFRGGGAAKNGGGVAKSGDLETPISQKAWYNRFGVEGGRGLERGGIMIKAATMDFVLNRGVGALGLLPTAALKRLSPEFRKLTEAGAFAAKQVAEGAEAPELQRDPDSGIAGWVGSLGGEALPVMVEATILGLVNPVLGMASIGVNEGYSGYTEAKKRNLSEGEARFAGDVIGVINTALETFQLKTAFQLSKKVFSALKAKVTKSVIAKTTVSGALKELPATMIKEAMTEALQEQAPIWLPEIMGGTAAVDPVGRTIGSAIGGAVLGLGPGGVRGAVQGLRSKAVADAEAAADASIDLGATNTAALRDIAKGEESQGGEPVLAADASTPVTEPPANLSVGTRPEDMPPVKKTLAEVTSARTKMVNQDREAMGLSPILTKGGEDFLQTRQRAIDSGLVEKASAIAASVNKDPRAIDRVATGALVQRMVELKVGIDRVNDSLGGQPIASDRIALEQMNQFVREFNTLSAAVIKSGSEEGKDFVARKLTLDKSYDLATIQARARAAAGQELTEHAKERVRTNVNELSDTDKRLKAEQTKYKKSVLNEAVVKRAKSKNVRTKAEILTDLKSLIERGCYGG